MDIIIPDKNKESLSLARARRDMYNKNIAIKAKVLDWQLWIIVGSGMLELLSMFLGIDVEDYTDDQYKLLNIYEKDLEKMCDGNYGGLLEDYSPQAK